jgi:hypothetical protein
MRGVMRVLAIGRKQLTLAAPLHAAAARPGTRFRPQAGRRGTPHEATRQPIAKLPTDASG